MPLDAVRVAETRAWFRKVASDLRAATLETTANPPILDDAVFHWRQAVEKALKGFLAWHDQAFRKTHNLEEIGAACQRLDPTLKELIDRAVPLTEYAWKFRYPGEPEEPSHDEATGALALAREISDAIMARLPSEVRP